MAELLKDAPATHNVLEHGAAMESVYRKLVLKINLNQIP